MTMLRRIVMIFAALVTAALIASLQLSWNFRTPEYLHSVAMQARVNQTIAELLPQYAAEKLPDADATRKVFGEQVTAATVADMLNPLYQSVSYAYVGKTDVVAFSLHPLLDPITATGYQIPPGTVFAQDEVQVSGLAPVLRTTARALPTLALVTLAAWLLLLLVSSKSSPLRALRNALGLTAFVLGGFVLAALALPSLIEALLSSSALDQGLRDVIMRVVHIVFHDSVRYYAVWIGTLLVASLSFSIAAGLTHRAKKPVRSKPTPPAPTTKEL